MLQKLKACSSNQEMEQRAWKCWKLSKSKNLRSIYGWGKLKDLNMAQHCLKSQEVATVINELKDSKLSVFLFVTFSIWKLWSFVGTLPGILFR